jgi:phosphate starvation-inducible PhoH-like protein
MRTHHRTTNLRSERSNSGRRKREDDQGAPVKRSQRIQAEREIAPRPFHIQPKTHNQSRLIDSIESYAITVTKGPAGTGKTYISAMTSARLYLKGGYDAIILSRANVPTGRTLGHFPGTIQEKMAPWLAPVINVLKQGLTTTHYENLVAKDRIQIQPLETIRGQSFENSIVLIDEAQNLTFEEIKAITTRLGEGSKLVLMGDPYQSDVDNGDALNAFCAMCERNNIEIPVVEFTIDDIVRSDIVAQLVKMFMTEDGSAITPKKRIRKARPSVEESGVPA